MLSKYGFHSGQVCSPILPQHHLQNKLEVLRILLGTYLRKATQKSSFENRFINHVPEGPTSRIN